MKATILLGSVFLIPCFVMSQNAISVFSCQNNDPVTQSAILTAPSDYQKQCVTFNSQSYTFNGSFNKAVKATDKINVKPSNFHAGAFASNGKMHLKIEKSPFDVFVMNYDNLNNVKRLEKLELGIQLPSPVSTYVNNFIAKQLNPDLVIDPSLMINPFLDWELDVEAIFHHTDGSYVKVIDGFFTRDFKRNNNTNLWDDQNTPYPMRIRFAPPKIGEWTCSILVKMNNVEVATSSLFRFHVVESGSPGYVQVADNARNLKRNGQYIFPVGQNFPAPEDFEIEWGWSNTTPATAHLCARVNDWNAYLEKIEGYADAGGQYIRTIQHPGSSLIEFEKKGNYFDRLHYAWEQDNLLDLCKKRDILVMFTLMHHYPIEMRGEGNRALWDWDRWYEQTYTNGNPPELIYDTSSPYVYCYNDNPAEVGGKKAYEMFMNESDLKYHEQRTRYYISRYGYSTQIYEFEIMSEPWHLDQKLLTSTTGANSNEDEPYFDDSEIVFRDHVIEAVGNYHERIARYIKNTMGHYEHLVGVNAPNQGWRPDPSQSKIMDLSWTIDEVDIIGINPYKNSPENLLKSNLYDLPNGNNENSLFKLVRFFAKSNDSTPEKPVIISEGSNPQSNCADNKLEWVDYMTLGFTGVCGFNMWFLNDGNKHGLWESQANVKNHMNGNDVISTISNGGGLWRQERTLLKVDDDNDVVELKEAQMYISEDQERAVGYVRNRSYNLQTIENTCGNQIQFEFEHEFSTLENFYWYDGPPVKAVELKNNTDYRIHWYRENEWVQSECRKSTDWGKLHLEHPGLIVESSIPGATLTPVVWFVIYQENCQSGLAQNNEIGEYNERSLLNDPDEEGLSVGVDYSLGLNPNPVARTEELTITSPLNQDVIFSNSQGMKVKKAVLSEGRNQLNLKDLDAGVYYLYFELSHKMIKLVVL